MLILFLSIFCYMQTLFSHPEEITLYLQNQTDKKLSVQGSNIPPQGAFMIKNSAHHLIGNRFSLKSGEQKNFSIPKECHSIALIEEGDDLCWTHDIPQLNKPLIVIIARGTLLIKDADNPDNE